jgi:hypothetical protein
MRSLAQAKARVAKVRKALQAEICQCSVPVLRFGVYGRTLESSEAEATAFYERKRAAYKQDGAQISTGGRADSFALLAGGSGECPVKGHKGRRLQLEVLMFLDTTGACECGVCPECLHRAGKCVQPCNLCQHAEDVARWQALHDSGKCGHACPHCGGREIAPRLTASAGPRVRASEATVEAELVRGIGEAKALLARASTVPEGERRSLALELAAKDAELARLSDFMEAP